MFFKDKARFKKRVGYVYIVRYLGMKGCEYENAHAGPPASFT